MADWAVIVGGTVTNIAVADANFATSQGWVPVSTGCVIGGTYVNGVFGPAPVVFQPYTLAKTTPWLRMTSDEATLVMGAMQTVEPRLQAIYAAATYISTADALFSVLHDLVASALGSSTRADELLARES